MKLAVGDYVRLVGPEWEKEYGHLGVKTGDIVPVTRIDFGQPWCDVPDVGSLLDFEGNQYADFEIEWRPGPDTEQDKSPALDVVLHLPPLDNAWEVGEAIRGHLYTLTDALGIEGVLIEVVRASPKPKPKPGLKR